MLAVYAWSGVVLRDFRGTQHPCCRQLSHCPIGLYSSLQAADVQVVTHHLAATLHQHAGDTGSMTSRCECRAYDSSLDFPTPTERHVYPTVLDRAPVPMQAVLRPLLPASAFKPRLAAPAIGSGKLRGMPAG